MEFPNDYKREFVSLNGRCPYACLHCYTYDLNYDWEQLSTIDEIIDDLKKKTFDIVYVSGHRENFIDVDLGIELTQKIYDNFKCDILITTRNVFDDEQIEKVVNLNQLMKKENKSLYFCVSIPALDSYKKLEPSKMIPTPNERMEFLKRLHSKNIYTMLTIKPLCPDNFIPIKEALEIIENCHEYSNVILSSGIVVNDAIIERLKANKIDFQGKSGKLMECLNNEIEVVHVDVANELEQISELCKKYSVPFFEHSLPAIEYLKNEG